MKVETKAAVVDTKVVFFRVRAEEIVPPAAHGKTLRWWMPAVLHSPEWLAEHGDGWVPVSHQLMPVSESDVLISLMLSREVPLNLEETSDGNE